MPVEPKEWTDEEIQWLRYLAGLPNAEARRERWSSNCQDLAWAVKTLRRNLFQSLKDFALLVGSNRNTIGRCERRRAGLSSRVLRHIRQLALDTGINEALPHLDAEIELACAREEKRARKLSHEE
jgi:hypothetical protein